MDTRKIINSIDILRAFRGGATSISDAAVACSESRATIHRFLTDAENWKLVVRSTTDYTTTAAGDLVLKQYDLLEEAIQIEMSSLVALEYGPILLEILADSPTAGKAEIARRSGASRSTVQRNIDDFRSDEYGWITKQHRCYELTDDGEQVLNAYESFDEKIEIIEKKTEFLERYKDATLPPIEALAESRMVVSTVTDNQEVVREIKKIDTDDTETIRAISQAFSEELSDDYRSKMSRETDCELIVDRSVYKAITHPKRWEYFFEGLKWPKFQLLVYPNELTIGIGLYDDEYAMIAAYNSNHPFNAGLFGESDAFIEWVESVYEFHREQATSPGRDLFKWAVNR